MLLSNEIKRASHEVKDADRTACFLYMNGANLSPLQLVFSVNAQGVCITPSSICDRHRLTSKEAKTDSSHKHFPFPIWELKRLLLPWRIGTRLQSTQKLASNHSYICMYVCIRDGPEIRPLHRDLQ
jgi:hypothetical protein